LLTFMAECFWPGMTEAAVQEAGTRARRAARAASREGEAVRYLGAILVPVDEIALLLFEGDGGELVRTVSERAEIPFERILETVRLGSTGLVATDSPPQPPPDGAILDDLQGGSRNETE
jgi:hypothetical protein